MPSLARILAHLNYLLGNLAFMFKGYVSGAVKLSHEYASLAVAKRCLPTILAFEFPQSWKTQHDSNTAADS